MGFLGNWFGKAEKLNLQANREDADVSGEIDLGKVYPRIKGLYDDQNPEPAPESNGVVSVSLEDSPVFQRLAKGIGVFYMIDQGDRYQIILNRQLSENLTIEKLHETALKNMAKAVNDKIQVNGDPGNIMMLTNGGDFEATMMLADFLWEQIEPVFKDNICIAIPTNDVLLITAKNNTQARENLKDLVRWYFEDKETKGLIVRHLYERVSGGWNYMETA